MSATISNLLAVRAERLGVYIKVLDQEEPDIDFGLFVLCCAETDRHIWERGLPAEGIATALNCFERELKLRAGGDVGEAWADFRPHW
jgi:hypothetical protein